MAFDPKAVTERLDKLAEEVQEINPVLALQLDKVSDVLEGRKEATSLKYDADEARYMADHFNYKVRSRNSDEPYMDEFNKSDFSQTSDAYAKMPGHSKAASEEKAPEMPEMKEEEKKEEKKASFSAPYRKL